MTQHGTPLPTHLAQRPSFAPRLVGGFTAIELMVTVAIMAVLMALAAPSFTPLIEGWRVRQATEQLQSTLYYARSEAIKRGGQVVVQKLPNGTNSCTTASTTAAWGCGWVVCHDSNNSGTCTGADTELQRYDTPSQIEIQRTANGATIQLNRWGLVSGTFVGFSLLPKGKSISDPNARGVCMSSGGRIRIIRSEELPCTS